MIFNTKNDNNKRHSDLFFLKKSGNEKNTVTRIGEKIKRPTPGENSIPYDAAKRCEIVELKINPDSSAPRSVLTIEADDLTSGMIYLKGPSYAFRSLYRL